MPHVVADIAHGLPARGWVTKLYTCALFIIGSLNVVLDDAGFSISNSAFLVKFPH